MNGIAFDAAEARSQYERSVPPSHPDHWLGAEVHRQGGVTIWWGGYEYVWGFTTRTPAAALYLIAHVARKQWPGITGRRISRLLEEIGRVHGWNVWEPNGGPKARGTTADQERAKLTPQLRWRVLKRDGHRCRGCGAGPEHGAVLHIDHIKAITKGGTTVFENLQTLCAACNYGKRTG